MGNLFLYSVNLENSTVFSYFDILIRDSLPSLVKKSLVIINEELSETPFISLVIFGSFADGKQTEKSDLDLAVFVHTAEDKKQGELALLSAELKSILPVDAHVFTKEEMQQMLREKNENVGKQIAYKHLPVHNPRIFYAILNEGINNGFKIVYPEG